MSEFENLVATFSNRLQLFGYTLKPHLSNGAPVRVVFPESFFEYAVVAIPDVHLSNAGPGDVFFNNDPTKPKRLAATLRSLLNIMNSSPVVPIVAVQLGDWFDVWRTSGGDVCSVDYGPIQNAAAYSEILDLDAELGLSHVIGNHDASFLRALPDRRTRQCGVFGLGLWLGDCVYSMHGHQSDIAVPANSKSDEFFVAAATTMARLIPGENTFEAYIDRYGTDQGLKNWLLSGFGILRGDPQPQPWPKDPATPPAGIQADFVLREGKDTIARVAQEAAKITIPVAQKAQVVIVGHSHIPSISFSTAGDYPVVIIDAGSWTYDQTNILLAADDTAAVFDVVCL